MNSVPWKSVGPKRGGLDRVGGCGAWDGALGLTSTDTQCFVNRGDGLRWFKGQAQGHRSSAAPP